MNICIFGDSITWGAYDPKNGGWANLIRNYFESEDSPPYFREAGDVTVYNLGICGNTSEDLLKRFNIEAEARKPEVIIFAIGINDAKSINSETGPQTRPTQFSFNIIKLVKLAKKYTEKIVFIGPTQVDENRTSPNPWQDNVSFLNKNIQLLDRKLQIICRKNYLTYIPSFNLTNADNLFDGLHPNTAGHQKIYETVKPVIENLVAQIK